MSPPCGHTERRTDSQEAEQVVTHQPARSFPISFQHQFNRAGGRTSNVLQRKTTHMNLLRWLLLVMTLYVGGYFVIIAPSARAYSGGRPTRWSASSLDETGRSKNSFVFKSEIHWTNYFYAPLDYVIRSIFYRQADLRMNKAYELLDTNTSP